MKTTTKLSLAVMAAATAASTSSVSAKLHKGASASDERILKKDKSGKQTGEASSAVVDPTATDIPGIPWWITNPAVYKICGLASASNMRLANEQVYPIWSPNTLAKYEQLDPGTPYSRGFAFIQGPVNCAALSLDSSKCLDSPEVGQTPLLFSLTGLLPSSGNSFNYLGLGLFTTDTASIQNLSNVSDYIAREEKATPAIDYGYTVGFKLSCSSPDSSTGFYGVAMSDAYVYMCETQMTVTKVDIELDVVHMLGFGLVKEGEECPSTNSTSSN